MELPADAVWHRNLWILISMIFQINWQQQSSHISVPLHIYSIAVYYDAMG